MNSEQFERAKLLENRFNTLQGEYKKMERLRFIAGRKNGASLFFSAYDNAAGTSIGGEMADGLAVAVLDHGMEMIQREMTAVKVEFNSLVEPCKSDESGQQSG